MSHDEADHRINQALGAELLRARHARKYSRARLTELSGVPGIVIRRIEAGQRAAPVPLLIRLCMALGVRPGEVVGRAVAEIEQLHD